MTAPNQPDSGVMKITRQDVFSAHVDDLLARQKSLRGEGRGVTRRGRGRWYYRNWFVFMIAGGLAAFAAWGVLEPSFNDEQYIQGTISGLDRSAVLPRSIQIGQKWLNMPRTGDGLMTLNGDHVWLLEHTRIKGGDGKWTPLPSNELREGQRIGVHVEYYPAPGEDIALAEFVVRDPPPQSPGRAAKTLKQLNAQSDAAGFLMFGVVAGFIGLALGAVDGLVCRLPRRALMAGAVGLAVGFLGGFISGIVANIVYVPISALALRQVTDTGTFTSSAFGLQMLGRSLAWGCAGLTMGLGQGVALRSGRLLVWGLLGGIVGGVLGGLLFDPVDMLLLDPIKPSAHVSRLVGIVAIGLAVGSMIGVVELLARDAWLRMTEGPLAGKEFLLFKDLMRFGSSPSMEIYLFNDPLVAGHHANLRMVGGEADIEAAGARPIEVNTRRVDRARLRHGDRITIGRTSFVFEKRGG